MRSNELKQKARGWQGIPDAQQSLLHTPLPRLVWVTEGSDPADLGKVRARVVGDPTMIREADRERTIWYHVDDVFAPVRSTLEEGL